MTLIQRLIALLIDNRRPKSEREAMKELIRQMREDRNG